MNLSAREMALLDRWQREFPLTERPFAVAGRFADCDETATLETFRRLRDLGILSRIGAVVRPNTVGASTLAAMQVPAPLLHEVSALVSHEPLVNHNYERTHAFNLWFVVAGPDPESVSATLARIAAATGLAVLDLPLERAYHLDLGFPLTESPSQPRDRADPIERYDPAPFDRALLAQIEDGLPMVTMPYRMIADRLGVDEARVIERLRQLSSAGVVTRFGCVVRHRALGYTANAMAVWDIADQEVDRVAAIFAAHPRVTLCYRRPRRPPLWPYNLFCMVHAKSKTDAHAVIDALNGVAGVGPDRRAVLFSTRCFKQRGAIFAQQTEMVH
ncbi:MAG: hypothetical protein IT536_09340 [Hyphomicrobiales bacterium]|nr:hypothetical protein [Hyphomicrobiales bacterium]